MTSSCSCICWKCWMHSWRPLVIGMSLSQMMSASVLLCHGLRPDHEACNLLVHEPAVALEVVPVGFKACRRFKEALQTRDTHNANHRLPFSRLPDDEAQVTGQRSCQSISGPKRDLGMRPQPGRRSHAGVTASDIAVIRTSISPYCHAAVVLASHAPLTPLWDFRVWGGGVLVGIT